MVEIENAFCPNKSCKEYGLQNESLRPPLCFYNILK